MEREDQSKTLQDCLGYGSKSAEKYLYFTEDLIYELEKLRAEVGFLVLKSVNLESKF